jgi:hypothetical protein
MRASAADDPRERSQSDEFGTPVGSLFESLIEKIKGPVGLVDKLMRLQRNLINTAFRSVSSWKNQRAELHGQLRELQSRCFRVTAILIRCGHRSLLDQLLKHPNCLQWTSSPDLSQEPSRIEFERRIGRFRQGVN